jgi:hypothetical protein
MKNYAGGQRRAASITQSAQSMHGAAKVFFLRLEDDMNMLNVKFR